MNINNVAYWVSTFAMMISTLTGCSDEGGLIKNRVDTPEEKIYVPIEARIKSESLRSTNIWFHQGKDVVIDKTQMFNRQQSRPTKARNIILFVGHGMGVSTLTAARIYQGQKQPDNQGGEEHTLSFERFPYTSLLKTYSQTHQGSDDASSITAIMTGVKSFKGGLAISAKSHRGDCQETSFQPLMSLVDLAKNTGMHVGLITNGDVTQATIAGTYAKTPEKSWHHHVPSSSSCHLSVKDIATQLIEYRGSIDLVLGGGRHHFYPTSEKGGRSDGVNLVNTWANKYPQGSYLSDWQHVQTSTGWTLPILGLFSGVSFEWLDQRPLSQPELAQMTQFAIHTLAPQPRGYFLVVESRLIGDAHQNGNAARALQATVELSDAVEQALQQVDLDETLIVVTANHSYPMTIAGYPARGNPILGLVSNSNGQPALAHDKKPYTTLGYNFGSLNNTNFSPDGERVDLSLSDPTQLDFKQPYVIPLNRNEISSSEDVPAYAIGPGAHWFRGLQEQNILFHLLNQAGQLEVVRK